MLFDQRAFFPRSLPFPVVPNSVDAVRIQAATQSLVDF